MSYISETNVDGFWDNIGGDKTCKPIDSQDGTKISRAKSVRGRKFNDFFVPSRPASTNCSCRAGFSDDDEIPAAVTIAKSPLTEAEYKLLFVMWLSKNYPCVVLQSLKYNRHFRVENLRKQRPAN